MKYPRKLAVLIWSSLSYDGRLKEVDPIHLDKILIRLGESEVLPDWANDCIYPVQSSVGMVCFDMDKFIYRSFSGLLIEPVYRERLWRVNFSSELAERFLTSKRHGIEIGLEQAKLIAGKLIEFYEEETQVSGGTNERLEGS
jgi:hypothetical protein